MRTVGLIGCFLAATTICGCGGGNPSTIDVTGTVTYKGATVEGANVVFGPVSGGGHAAAGVTDAAGRFTLTTFEKDDGVLAGSYTVAISKTETTGGMSEEEEHAEVSAGKEVPAAKTVDFLPLKYKDGLKSGLTAEVTPDGEKDFAFALVDGP